MTEHQPADNIFNKKNSISATFDGFFLGGLDSYLFAGFQFISFFAGHGNGFSVNLVNRAFYLAGQCAAGADSKGNNHNNSEHLFHNILLK